MAETVHSQGDEQEPQSDDQKPQSDYQELNDSAISISLTLEELVIAGQNGRKLSSSTIEKFQKHFKRLAVRLMTDSSRGCIFITTCNRSAELHDFHIKFAEIIVAGADSCTDQNLTVAVKGMSDDGKVSLIGEYPYVLPIVNSRYRNDMYEMMRKPLIQRCIENGLPHVKITGKVDEVVKEQEQDDEE